MLDKELRIELNRRDRKNYERELSELQSSLVSAQSGIFWTALSLLIIEPAITAGMVYYFYDQLKSAALQGAMITNFGSNIKWASVIIAIVFTCSSINLLWNLWRVASLNKQIAEIRTKISNLEVI